MENGSIVRNSVGRDAKVGDLYDARSDTFPGFSIFNDTPPSSAIRTTDTPLSDIKYIFSDKLSEKFDKLNISAELRASFLGGLVTLKGHGKYLSDEKKSKRSVRSSLLHSIQTKVEKLDLFNRELKGYFSLDALDVCFATHVVVEVSWGAKSMFTLEHTNPNNEESKKIEGTLQANLKKIFLEINGEASVDYNTGENICEDSFSFRVFGDILPGGKLPQTVEEALELVKKMPDLIKLINKGKGKPLQYTLLPISILNESLLGPTEFSDQLVKQVDEQAIICFVRIFDEILTTKQQLNDLVHDIQNHKHCVPNERIRNLSQIKTGLDKVEEALRSKLGKTLIDVRSGKAGAKQLEAIRGEFLSSDFSLEKVKTMIKDYANIVEKISFADELIQEGVIYIGIGASLGSELMKNPNGDIYILFFGTEPKQLNHQSWSGNRNHFLRLLRSSKTSSDSRSNSPEQSPQQTFVAVDLDVCPEIAAKEGVGEGIRICHFKNKEYVDYDVYSEHLRKESLCYARSTEEMKHVNQKPNNRVNLELQCPGSGFLSNCEIQEYTWVCFKCEKTVEYGFDEFFYCKCGRQSVQTYQFKCSSKKHDSDFISFPPKKLIKLLEQIRPLKELNILLLGETGVGKSTIINGIMNYITFQTLEEAEKHPLLCSIHTSFTMMVSDKSGKKIPRDVTTGPDKNEMHGDGKSSTQEPRSYVFPWKNTLVRLIDTPGIGDTRGIVEDKKNFDKILNHLSHYDEIHGVCILLKPNESRLTVMFRFCINELLTHLHRSLSQNIVFCFTNARGTFYQPGDTYRPLKKLLSENKEVQIHLSDYTTYCMDNEAFRFLCAVHNEIKFDENDHKSFSASWNKSVAEIQRMFTHISTLTPHVTKDTLSLNEARKLILNMTKPIADISQNIQDNIAVLEEKKRNITATKNEAKKLEDELYIPSIKIEAVPLGYPRTVCTSKKCTSVITIQGRLHNDYIQHCHEHCYLADVIPEQCPEPKLQSCGAMDNNFNCTVCHCRWDEHMHTTFYKIKTSVNIMDPSVKAKIDSKTSAAESIEKFVETIETRVDEYRKEQATIISISVKFGRFLKDNAIIPYNDAIVGYLDHLIKQEENKIAIGGDTKVMEGLKKMRLSYIEEKRILDESIAKGKNADVLKPVDIKTLTDVLFSLKNTGSELKQIVEVALNTKSKMMSHIETFYRPDNYEASTSGMKKSEGGVKKMVKESFGWIKKKFYQHL